MAEIDPNIALSYRPPNLATMPNLQIQTPLESLARVVSLRSLMQEGQLKGLQLQQLRLQLQGAQNLANLYGSMYPDTGADTGIPGATPGSQYSTGAGLPAAPAGGTATPTYSIPPPAPLAGGAPVTPLGVDVTAGLDKYLTAPAATPAPTDTGAGVTPTVTPGTLAGAPPPGLFAPAPESRTPTLGQFVRADPLGGVAAYEQMMKARKEMYDEADKRLTLRKSQSESVANLLNGVTDQESLVRNLPEMVRTGALSGAQADYIMKRGFDDPFVQKWIQERQIQSIGYDKAIDLAIKQHGENRAQLLFPPQLSKAMTDQQLGERQTAADTVGQVQDDKGWPEWFKAQGPTAQALYAPIITNPNLSFAQKQQIIQLGAGGAQKAAEAGATKGAEYKAEMEPYEDMIQGVMGGKYRLQDFSQSIQDKIGPELTRRGWGQAATGGQATGGAAAPSGFAKPVSDAELERLNDLNKALTVVDNGLALVNKPENANMMGPVKGFLSTDPFHADVRGLRDALTTNQQQLKAFITNKSLRGFTPETLDKTAPGIYTDATEARNQYQFLRNRILEERDAYVKELRAAGKALPPGFEPQAAAPQTVPSAAPPAAAPPPQAPPAAAPSKQAPAAVKIPADVQKQLNRGAGKYTLPDGRVFYKKKDGSIVAGQ